MDGKNNEITPYRMSCLMEVAAKISKQMTTGIWHLTFDEMELVVDIVKREIDAHRPENFKEDT